MNGWGVEYFRWAVGAKMISRKANGNGTYRLDPQGYATRAECAKMIQVFLQKYTGHKEIAKDVPGNSSTRASFAILEQGFVERR